MSPSTIGLRPVQRMLLLNSNTRESSVTIDRLFDEVGQNSSRPDSHRSIGPQHRDVHSCSEYTAVQQLSPIDIDHPDTDLGRDRCIDQE